MKNTRKCSVPFSILLAAVVPIASLPAFTQPFSSVGTQIAAITTLSTA